MNLDKKEALKIGEKVLKDIDYCNEDIEEPTVKFDNGEYLHIGEDTWLISFPYGAEDYGVDEKTGKSRAFLHITIFDDDGIATSVSYRNGYIQLEYDRANDVYSIKERRP